MTEDFYHDLTVIQSIKLTFTSSSISTNTSELYRIARSSYLDAFIGTFFANIPISMLRTFIDPHRAEFDDFF